MYIYIYIYSSMLCSMESQCMSLQKGMTMKSSMEGRRFGFNNFWEGFGLRKEDTCGTDRLLSDVCQSCVCTVELQVNDTDW